MEKNVKNCGHWQEARVDETPRYRCGDMADALDMARCYGCGILIRCYLYTQGDDALQEKIRVSKVAASH